MKGRLVCGKESRKQARKRKKCGEKILEKNEMTPGVLAGPPLLNH